MTDQPTLAEAQEWAKSQQQAPSLEEAKAWQASQAPNEVLNAAGRQAETMGAEYRNLVPALAKSLINKAGESLGFDPGLDNSNNLRQHAADVASIQQRYPTQAPEHWQDAQTPDQKLKYMESTVGSAIPQIAAGLATGGIGAKAGEEGFLAAARLAGTDLAEPAAQKALQSVIAKSAGFGMLSQMAPQSMSEEYWNEIQKGHDNPFTAVLSGGLQAGIQTYAGAAMGSINKLLGPGLASGVVADTLLSKFGGLASTVGKIGAENAAANLGATGVSILTDHFLDDKQDLFSKENATKMMDAGLQGLTVGSLAGGITHGLAPSDTAAFKPKSGTELLTSIENNPNKPAPSTIDHTAITPTTIPDDLLKKASDLGINKESLANLTPDQAKNVFDQVQKLSFPKPEAFDVGPVDLEKGPYSTAIFTTDLPKFKEALDRQDLIKNGAEPTPQTIDYQPGDGVIQKGSMVNDEPIIGSLADKVKIDDNGAFEARAQRALPVSDNLHDLTHAMDIGGMFHGFKLSDKYAPEHNNVIDHLHRIVGEVFKGVAKPILHMYDSLHDSITNDPVRGVQLFNHLHLALQPVHEATETAYHEMAHTLIQQGAFKKSEMDFMLGQTEKLKVYHDPEQDVHGSDYNRWLETAVGKEELLANALGKATRDYRLDPKSYSDVPSFLKDGVRKMRNLLDKTKNYLNGQGFHSFDDIVQSMVHGERAGITGEGSREHLEALADMNHANATARAQVIAKEMRENDQKKEEQSFREVTERAKAYDNQKASESGKKIWLWGRWVRSMYNEGQRTKLGGLVVNSMERKFDNVTKLLSSFGEKLGSYTEAARTDRYRVAELADKLSSKGVKAFVGSDGLLKYHDPDLDPMNNLVTVSHPKGDAASRAIAKNYMHLQDGFKEVLTERENAFKRTMREGLEEHLPEKYTRNDVSNAWNKIVPNGDKDLQGKKDELANIHRVLGKFDAMRQSDYYPSMRFGSFGYSVRDISKLSPNEIKEAERTGKWGYMAPLEAFHTIESGSFNNLYNQRQLKETMAHIKENYGDDKKYAVIGGKGRITNFDHTKDHPFTMTYDILKKNIDPRYLNVDMLHSLLSSHDIDPTSYAQMVKDLHQDITTKKFDRQFKESRNVAGYSKDYDRVTHGYFSGSAHFIAGLEHQKELSALRTSIAGLSDENLKAKMTNFLSYTNEHQEDLQRLRTANMLWCMGGNVSTALTVLMTLPTTTLGHMAKYDPNTLKNMARIGKWMKISAQIFASSHMKTLAEDGSMNLAPERGMIDRLVKNGTIQQSQADFFNKMMDYGKIKSQMLHESVNSFASDGLSTMARYLGTPVAYAEKMVRAATLMASHEMLETSKDAQGRAQRVLSKDMNFQAALVHNKELSFNEHASLNLMNKAHGVYGKIGRPDMFKGLGGSLFMPFQTFPYYAVSGIAKMLGEGKEGKQALATTVGALMMVSGLQGIPGVEELEDLYDGIFKATHGGQETNAEQMIREKIYGMTGNITATKFLTQGFGRAYLGVSASKRWGIPVPGYDTIKSALGIGGGKPSGVMGVEGTVFQGISNAWNEYNSGSGPVDIMKAMTPTAVSNPLKAMALTMNGLQTNPGAKDTKMTLIKPEDITKASIWMKALGMTSDQIAEAQTKHFVKSLVDGEDREVFNRAGGQLSQLYQGIVKAQQTGDRDMALKYQEAYRKRFQDLATYMQQRQITMPQGFVKAISKNAVQNVTAIEPINKRYYEKEQEANKAAF